MKIFKIFILLNIFFLNNVQSQIFVSASATGSDNGTSWPNAYTNLQKAINAAKSGQEIWVKTGTYYPSLDRNGAVPFTPRLATFVLKEGVKVYGGFAGTETVLNQRNPEVNITTLSGDIGVVNDDTDNIYTLLLCVDLTSESRIDGFTITKANNDRSSGNLTIGTYVVSQSSGGAGWILSSDIVITNNKFIGNKSGSSAGGLFIRYGSIQTLVNNVFTANESVNQAGALYCIDSSISLDNCIFTDNLAGAGAAAYIYNNAVSAGNISNCTFTNNKSKADGGALLFYASDPLVRNEITITDSTFDNNSCVLGVYNGLSVIATRGGAIYADRTNLNISRCNFANHTIKFKNSGGASGGAINVGDNTATKIDKCNFINNSALPNTTGNNGSGGAIDASSEIAISNCIFEGNHSAGSSGAIDLTTTSTTKNKIAVANCVFIQNTATINAGAIYYGTSLASYPTGFTNLTFYANNATQGGALYFNLNSQIQQTTQVQNCIFEGNSANEIAYYGTSDSGKLLKSNNRFQTDNFSGSLFQNAANPIGDDGIWRTVDDGLYLNPCSLIVDSGNNTGLILPGTENFWTQDDIDITGKARIKGIQVDLGAYESDPNAKSPQTITFAATATKNYGDAIYTLPLNTSAGLPVTYTSSDSEIVSISGNIINILKVGSVTITANQPGNECNNPMLEATQILTVSPKAITVSGAVVANKVYDGNTTASVSGGSLVGVVSGDVVTLTQAGTFTNQNKGTAKTVTPTFSIGGASAGNYTLTQPSLTADIIAKPITVSADAKSKVYGAADPALTYQITTGALVNGDALIGTLSRAIGENVGTSYAITSTLNNTNYDITYMPANFAITTKPITVTADAKLKIYGAADPALTYQITTGALVNGDTLNGTLSRVIGENVGITYAITSTLSNSNYDITYVPANFVITAKALTVAGATVSDKVYDGTSTASINGGLLVGIVSGDDVTLTQSGTFVNQTTGTAKAIIPAFTIGGVSAGNYTLTQPSLTADITAKSLTVTGAAAFNKVYDGTTNASVNGGSLVGVVSGDVVTLTQVGTFADKNIGNAKAITPAFSISGASAGNYTLSQPSLTADITAKPITVTADAKSKVYGANDPVLTYQITAGSLVNGDDLIGTLSRSIGENVGVIYKIISTLSNANYAVTYVPANFAITAKSLTVTGATATNKVYDGTTNASVNGGSLVGVVSGDVVTLTQVGTFVDKNAGINKAIISSFTVGGESAGNYTLTQPSLTADITAKSLTVTGAAAFNKVYDGTTNASVNGGSLVGVVSGDVVTLTQVGTFADKNIGSAKTITSAFTIGGASIGNYTLIQPSLIADITAKALTVTGATATNKVYDGNTTVSINGGSLVGIVSGDVVTLTQVGTFVDKNIGTAKTITPAFTISGASTGNYTLTQPSLTADIIAKPITVKADAKLKIYGAADPALTYQITTGALVNGDILNGTLSRAIGENVGITYAITSTLSNANYDITYVPANFVITAKALTVAGATVSDKVYDGTTTASINGGLLVGIVSGDDVTLTQSGTFVNQTTGTAKAIIPAFTIGGDSAANYTLIQPSLTADIIAKPITVKADAKSKVYGASDPLLTYQITTGTLVNGDALIGTLSRTKGENVGTTYMITSTLSNGNYDITYVSTNFVITKAVLTITANNQTRVFGAANPVLAITYSGFVNGDSEVSLTTPATASTVADAISLVGTYDIKVDGAVSDNYSFNYINGTLTVISSLGTNTFDTAAFSYYPNPVRDVLNVSLDHEITSIDVYNILGQQVMSQSVYARQTRLDMSSLQEGSYLVRVISGLQSKLIKIVRTQ